MKRAGSTYGILLAVLLCMTAPMIRAQTKPADIWASVQFNKQQVFPGEPLLVTITVYTSTWFTGPPEFGEIQVPEAMMVDYQQRTGSMRKTIGNRSYPAVEKKYVVYPFRTGENSLPSLKIEVESPPEGDYKGKRSVIRSPERTFTVLTPPEGISSENWLTAVHVSLIEHWDKPMDQLKQGDVRERQIVIRAEGALAALIPPLELNAGSFGNVYSKPAQLSNAQNQNSFTGTRTENWTYLMEKEGNHQIPGTEISWFDPGSGQLKHARLEEREIHIAENPNLDFLLSMQDSLQSMLESEAGKQEKEPFKWKGLNWWQLSVIAMSLAVFIIFVIRMAGRVRSSMREKRSRSKESEGWYFERLRKEKFGEPAELMRAVLSWYDRYRKDHFGPELEAFVCAWGEQDLRHRLDQLEKVVYGGAEKGGWNGKEVVRLLGEARNRAAGKHAPHRVGTLTPLNPVLEEPVHCIKEDN